MKTTKKTQRNPYTIPAKKRKAGKMRQKNKKRSNGTNKQLEILKEVDESNPHNGSTLQSLFEELGEWDEVKKLAEKEIKKINDHL